MIDDTNANFNQTVRAFDLFWANKTLPIRLDNEGKDLSKSEEENEEEEASETKSEYQQFTYDVKRYLNWKQRNQNLVKPDGHILTPHEIYMQWLKSQPHE
jgi:hypothetical protein